MESELNGWDYQFLSQRNIKGALSVFKLNGAMYPQSGNAYDSLGEIFEVVNDKNGALANYKKTLLLEPKHKHAADRILALDKT